jgi:hypothetical protein
MKGPTVVYAVSGINWEFLYEVEYEDELILVLRDMGRYHRYDESRMYKGPIAQYIEIIGEWAWLPGGRKLVEVRG